VQDCVERALTKCNQFQAGTNLNAWLMTIMRRIFINTKRQNMRYEQILQQHCTLTASDDYQSTSPSQLHHVELGEVERAFMSLRKHHRQSIELVAVEQRSHEEAAGVMGVSVATAKTRLFRAREMLRQSLGA
jgi:RNA polymerase sigma-70 factor (ECF subfamily)